MKMILILYIFTQSYLLALLLQPSEVVQCLDLPAEGLPQDRQVVGAVVESAYDFLALAEVGLVGAAGVQEVLLLGKEGLVDDAPTGRLLGGGVYLGGHLYGRQEIVGSLFLTVDKSTSSKLGLTSAVLLSLDLFEVPLRLTQRVDAIPLQEPLHEEGASLGESGYLMLRCLPLLLFALLILGEEVVVVGQSLSEHLRLSSVCLRSGRGVVVWLGGVHPALLF